jgi:hypothetical protein
MAQKIEKSQWKPFLERASTALAGMRAEVEVASLKSGEQVEAAWLPLLGMTYNPRNDLIELDLEQFEHLIYHPQELYVEFGPRADTMISLEVRDGEGVQHLIELREPVALPAPGQGSGQTAASR